MKILHVTYHHGCKLALDFVAQKLGFDLTTQLANWNYNISQSRADEIWIKNKDYYNEFDLIITSDTGPLSRIFLRDEFKKKLIIWVCNRFDYTDRATNDCDFPDPGYYEVFRRSLNKDNVKVFSYTAFEHEYAKKYHNINWGDNTIKPCYLVENKPFTSAFPRATIKSKIFFIPPYHNDTIFMNLYEKCKELNINAYNGRYNGPLDLQGIKGIIHIPYAWSNLALFENWSLGNVYLIPEKNFLLQLSKQGDFFWSPPFSKEHIECSEWYLPEHKDLFVYFDSWSHLKWLTENYSIIDVKKQLVCDFSKEHTEKALNQWLQAIKKW